MIIRNYPAGVISNILDAISVSGFEKTIDSHIVSTIPSAAPSGGIYFFRPGRPLGVFSPAQEAFRRGLVLADPRSLIAFNTENPEFCDIHPNATVWNEKNGSLCWMSFRRRKNGNRYACIRNSDRGWDDQWWFAGVPRSL